MPENTTRETIGVNSRHTDYVTHFNEWVTCRTVMAGEEDVKLAGERYLPRLSQQSADEYNAYVGRTLFHGAAARTKIALVGMLFRKKPIIEFTATGLDAKSDKNKILDSFVPGIETLYSFMHQISDESLTTGRLGVLVDSDNSGKAYLSYYKAEDILNWRTILYRGQRIFTMVVLREVEEIENGFHTKYRHLFRVLRLDLETMTYYQEIYVKATLNENVNDANISTGKYAQSPLKQRYATAGSSATSREFLREIHAMGDGESREDFYFLGENIPVNQGQKFDRIPFYPINCGKGAFEISRPPLLDLVNVNISHYKSSADLEHGRHFTGLPTAWATGFNAKDKTFRIGSPELWSTTNDKAKVGFLEFTGQGLKSLENALQEKESLMAILGARLLEAGKAMPEAADSQYVRRAGETSVLADIADVISDMLSQAIALCAEWNSYRDVKFNVKIQKDYSSTGPNPQLLMALLQAVAAGALSQESLHHNLVKMDIVPDGVSAEDEYERILRSRMALSSQMGAIGTTNTKIGVRAEVSERPGNTSPRKERTPLERTLKNEAIGDN